MCNVSKLEHITIYSSIVIDNSKTYFYNGFYEETRMRLIIPAPRAGVSLLVSSSFISCEVFLWQIKITKMLMP